MRQKEQELRQTEAEQRDKLPAGLPEAEEEPIAVMVEPVVLKVIGPEQVREAAKTLEKYRNGRKVLEARVVDNEKWFKMHIAARKTGKSECCRQDSPWLFNSIVNKHADAMDNAPEANVLAREQGDENTAKQISEILPVVLEYSRFESVYSDAQWTKSKAGAAVLAVLWDGSAMNGLGEIQVTEVDLLSLYWEPGIKDIQESRNIFCVKLLDHDEVEALARAAGVEYRRTGLRDLAPQYAYDDQVDTTGKCAVVDWYYKKGGVLHYCKFSGDMVLYASENDPEMQAGYYHHGKYPFVIDNQFPIAGSPVGFGWVDVCKGTQQEIDRLRNLCIENAEWIANWQMLLNDSTGDFSADTILSNQHIIPVSGRLSEETFRMLQKQALPDSAMIMYNNMITELKEGSANRDFSQGGTTSGVSAASAIAALQEAGSKTSRDSIRSSYVAFEQVCDLCIELMRQFYTTPRMFRVLGDKGAANYVQFDAAALQPAPLMGADGNQMMDIHGELMQRKPIFDIKVSAAKKTTFSRLSQNETAKELYKLGVFDPANADRSLALLDMMDFEGIDKVKSKVQQNGTLQQQVQALQNQVVQLSAIVGSMTGNSGMTANAAAAMRQMTGKQTAAPQVESKTAEANSLGAPIGGNDLASQARRRAMNITNPNGGLMK